MNKCINPKKIKVLVFAPGLIPSVVIGILRPLKELTYSNEIALRIRISSFKLGVNRDIQWCDVAVFCRNCEFFDLHCLTQLKRLGKRVIYEIDDNFMEIPLTTPIGEYHRRTHRLHVLRRFYSLANLTRIYTVPMQNQAKEYGANTCLVKSYFDFNIIKNLPLPQPTNIIKIAYPTSRLDDAQFEQFFFEIIREILRKYGEKIEVHLWRDNLPQALLGFKQIILNKQIINYEKFVQEFYSMNIAIGLAPLLDEPFFRSKTNNKYRELGGCGIAGVYSNIPPYSDSVINRETGILCDQTIESWVNAISELIENPILRSNISKAAQIDVLQNYNFNQAVQSYRDAISYVLNNTPKTPQWLYDKKTPFFAVGVSLPSEVSQYFSFVVKTLGGTVVLYNNQYEVLKKRHIVTNAAFILIKVVNHADLSNLHSIASLSRSLVVDLTSLEIEKTQLHYFFAKSAPKMMTFLLTQAQEEIIGELRPLNCFITRIKDNPTNIDNDYSLNGLPAAYFDIFEKHLSFNTQYKVSLYQRLSIFLFLPNRFIVILKKLIAVMLLKIKIYLIGRIKRAWQFIQWRWSIFNRMNSL